jgi:hypothetical protein
MTRQMVKDAKDDEQIFGAAMDFFNPTNGRGRT